MKDEGRGCDENARSGREIGWGGARGCTRHKKSEFGIVMVRSKREGKEQLCRERKPNSNWKKTEFIERRKRKEY